MTGSRWIHAPDTDRLSGPIGHNPFGVIDSPKLIRSLTQHHIASCAGITKMVSFVAVTAVCLVALYAIQTYRKFATNLAAAKASGLPYIVMPIYTFHIAWLLSHKFFLAILDLLPSSMRPKWIP